MPPPSRYLIEKVSSYVIVGMDIKVTTRSTQSSLPNSGTKRKEDIHSSSKMTLKLPIIPLALVILSITGVYLQGSHLHAIFRGASDDLRPHARCNLLPHEVNFTRGDCNKTIILMSCSGKCVSETTPYFFASR